MAGKLLAAERLRIANRLPQPVVLDAFPGLNRIPDPVLVDGQGIAHPRRLGPAISGSGSICRRSAAPRAAPAASVPSRSWPAPAATGFRSRPAWLTTCPTVYERRPANPPAGNLTPFFPSCQLSPLISPFGINGLTAFFGGRSRTASAESISSSKDPSRQKG
jgi:hypothetical protein